MLKMRMLLLMLLCTGMTAMAQVDTTAKKDTIIHDDIKDGIIDNIHE